MIYVSDSPIYKRRASDVSIFLTRLIQLIFNFFSLSFVFLLLFFVSIALHNFLWLSKSPDYPETIFTLYMKQSMIQFDLHWDPIFGHTKDQRFNGPHCGPEKVSHLQIYFWSNWKVWTKQGQCESDLKLHKNWTKTAPKLNENCVKLNRNT